MSTAAGGNIHSVILKTCCVLVSFFHQKTIKTAEETKECTHHSQDSSQSATKWESLQKHKWRSSLFLSHKPPFKACLSEYEQRWSDVLNWADHSDSSLWMNVLWISDVALPLYKYLAQMELCCWDGRSSQPVISQGRTQFDSDSISRVGKWYMPCSARRWALTWPHTTFHTY